MHFKNNLVFLLLAVHSVYGKGKVLSVKIDAHQIVSSLRTIFTTEYLDRFADIIAKRTAKYFVIELFKSLPKPSDLDRVSDESDEEGNRKDIKLDKREAMKLIQTPSPDGDNLDGPSKGLSKEQSEDSKKVPVYGLMKINGVYFRRLLGKI